MKNQSSFAGVALHRSESRIIDSDGETHHLTPQFNGQAGDDGDALEQVNIAENGWKSIRKPAQQIEYCCAVVARRS